MKNLSKKLSQRKDDQLYRRRLVLDGPQDVHVNIDGKPFLSFCSNDYLGLANHPEVVTAFQKAADKYGVGSGAAHLVSGHHREHHALEEELANFTRRPRALLFSTGYMANLGIAQALLTRSGVLFEDRLNHASLIDAGRLCDGKLVRYQHADANDLAHCINDTKSSNCLIASDGVFSMDGDQAPMSQLVPLAKEHGAWLWIDDAHGFGVLGEHGGGTLEQQSLSVEDVPVLMGTLGKAFGTFGAFVAGTDELIETLIQEARTYIYTTAIPAAVASATRTSLQLVRTEHWRREQLGKLISTFRTGASELGLPLMKSETPIQPVLIGSADAALRISNALRENGILLTAIRPPTVPAGTARLRVTLSANHTVDDVEFLLESLSKLVPMEFEKIKASS